jgi:hypothetical protein
MMEDYALATSQDATVETLFWRVVVARAIQDWLSKSASVRREAERYLFQNSDDLSLVCASAGINVDYLRHHLNKVRGQTLRDVLPLAA